MLGRINKIIDMSVVDGPGNRTAVFFQTCNYRCQYCHNPETIQSCIHCGDCVSTCPVGALAWEGDRVVWDPKTCVDCDKCIQVCPHLSSPKIRLMTPEALAEEVGKNRPFIQGVTASGGECTLQWEFLEEFFARVKALGLNTLADTNGGLDLSQEALKGFVAQCDGFMVDVKAWESRDHALLTGKENQVLKKNLTYLAQLGKLTEVRTVCLEGADNEGIIRGLAHHLAPFLAQAPLAYKLISYRPFGVRKEFFHLKAPKKEEMDRLRALAQDLGFGPVILT
ncbi:MAG: YjjW family glycine radical enzyme activase [Tissierellia bacterium]|nr:YjjW family glycine radical enzyme activase [Tissierellia bacterium]